jgi:hypothetical protein
VKARCGDT